MEETKHTPGPWIIDDEPMGPCRIVATDSANESVATRCVIIGEVYYTDLPFGVANAHLIVAAPDLRAACEAMIAADTPTLIDDAFTQMRAAIAKAAGATADGGGE
jgi:hypothetical protein